MLPPTTVKNFEAQDAADVRELIVQGLAERWGSYDPRFNPDLEDFAEHYRSSVVLVAKRRSRIVGVGVLQPEGEGAGRIVRMSVARDCRRQGIGTLILRGLLQAARERGYEPVVLETTSAWESAVTFYRSRGFAPIGVHDGDQHFALTQAEANGGFASRGSMLNEADLHHLRRAIDLAASARAQGNHPFGALLAGAGGDVLAEAENTVVTDRDVTAHAELNLVRLASRRYDEDTLAGSTLFSSTEPCVMCAGAIHWSKIGRVVYALPAERLDRLTGHNPAEGPRKLSCREVFVRYGRPIEVGGPALEAEAEEVHRDFWVQAEAESS